LGAGKGSLEIVLQEEEFEVWFLCAFFGYYEDGGTIVLSIVLNSLSLKSIFLRSFCDWMLVLGNIQCS
jgi:hypothetical protein